MSDPELRDYIAIQAMAAMLHNESMAINTIIENISDPDDTTAEDWMSEIAMASFHLAHRMMEVRNEVSNPYYQENLKKIRAIAADEAREASDE